MNYSELVGGGVEREFPLYSLKTRLYSLVRYNGGTVANSENVIRPTLATILICQNPLSERLHFVIPVTLFEVSLTSLENNRFIFGRNQF